MLRCSFASALLPMFLLALAGSCGAPTEPDHESGPPTVLGINEVAEGNIAGLDTARYTIRVPDDEFFRVDLLALEGAITLTVSAGSSTSETIGAAAIGAAIGRDSTSRWHTEGDTEIGLRIVGSGRYRVLLHIPLGEAEHIASAIAIGDTVAGERIDDVADADVFSFRVKKGEELIAYIQATDPNGGTGVFMNSLSDGADDFLWATSASSDTGLERQHTPRFVPVRDERYLLEVRGLIDAKDNLSYIGGYRLRVQRIDRHPEHAAETVSGTTMITNEALDYVGDIDEFTLRGTPGDEYNLFVRLPNASPGERIHARLATCDCAGAFSDGTFTNLLDNQSGVFVLPESGEVTLQVEGADSFELTPARGPYELYVYRIDHAPESVSATVSLGQLVGEQIEAPGDEDEFTLTVPQDTYANLTVESYVEAGSDDPPYAMAVSLYPHGSSTALTGTDVLRARMDGDTLWSTGSGTFRMPAGEYRVRVFSPYAKHHGPYRFRVYPVSLAPENAPVLVALGDTVNESIQPLGDEDTFQFDAQVNDIVDVSLQGLSPSSSGSLELTVYRDDAALPLGAIASKLPTLTLGENHTGHILISQAGRYSVNVHGFQRGQYPSDVGAYRFVVNRVLPVPEHHADVIAPGDTIADERIDDPNDVDEFHLRGTPGTEIVLYLGITEATRTLRMSVRDPVDGTTLEEFYSASDEQPSHTFTIPSSGEVIVRAYMDPRTWYESGAYRFWSRAIDRRPEHIASGFAIGDTVSGESVDFDGDVDEFTFSAAAGDRVVAKFRVPLGASGLLCEVVDPTDGTTFASLVLFNEASFDANATAAVSLPHDGTYVVRVQSHDHNWGKGAFQFVVARSP